MEWNNLKSKNLSLESVFLIGIDILVGRWDNSLQDNPEEFIPQLSGAGLPASPAHRLSGGYNTNAENRQISPDPRQNGIREI